MSARLRVNRNCNSRRSGFTLVELLVVIAIIGILVALLLPAIQAARESARRLQCQNNLKQIGIAILNFHDAKKAYPTAGTNSDDFYTDPKIGATAGFERFGWGYQILPYLEEATLYDAGKNNSAIVDLPQLTNRALCEVPVSAYSCPSRGVRFGTTPDGLVPALGDYAGVLFAYLLDQGKNSQSYTDLVGINEKKYGWRGIITKGGHFNGATYDRWREVRAKDVTDGTSKTVAIMEKAVWVGRYSPSDYSAGYSDLAGWVHNAHQTTMRSVSGDGGLAFGGTASFGTPGRGVGAPVLPDNADLSGTTLRSTLPDGVDQGFGSAHSSGFYAVFGDGSVRSISYDVDTTMGGVLFRLGCRDDGLNLDDGTY